MGVGADVDGAKLGRGRMEGRACSIIAFYGNCILVFRAHNWMLCFTVMFRTWTV